MGRCHPIMTLYTSKWHFSKDFQAAGSHCFHLIGQIVRLYPLAKWWFSGNGCRLSAEWSLLNPEPLSSNLTIGKKFKKIFTVCRVNEKSNEPTENDFMALNIFSNWSFLYFPSLGSNPECLVHPKVILGKARSELTIAPIHPIAPSFL